MTASATSAISGARRARHASRRDGSNAASGAFGSRRARPGSFGLSMVGCADGTPTAAVEARAAGYMKLILVSSAPASPNRTVTSLPALEHRYPLLSSTTFQPFASRFFLKSSRSLARGNFSSGP